MSEITVSQMYPNMVNRRKFTDNQLRELHGQGLSDREMSRRFKVHRTSVQQRRKKLGLPTNYEDAKEWYRRRKQKP